MQIENQPDNSAGNSAEKSNKKLRCEECYYFFNCQVEGNDIHEYCSANPEALGYCELWSGPLFNYNACHGFTPKKHADQNSI
ncbi:hypothetical protein [Candidatus Harpocratesius sp.]